MLITRTMLLIASLLSGLAQSQDNPQPKKPDQAKAQQKGGTKQQEITVNLPSSVNVTVSGKLDLPGAQEKGDQAGKQKHPWESLLEINITDILLAAFTGLLWWATIGLRDSTNKLWDESKKAGEAAARAANAAERAANLSEQAFHLLERADVHLEKVLVTPVGVAPSHQTVFILVYKNLGRSRALSCEVKAEIGTDGAEEWLGDAPEIVHFELGANSELRSPFSPISDYVTKETFAEIVKGTRKLKFTSDIKYYDVFGKRHGARNAGTYVYPGSFSIDLDESYNCDEKSAEQ